MPSPGASRNPAAGIQLTEDVVDDAELATRELRTVIGPWTAWPMEREADRQHGLPEFVPMWCCPTDVVPSNHTLPRFGGRGGFASRAARTARRASNHGDRVPR